MNIEGMKTYKFKPLIYMYNSRQFYVSSLVETTLCAFVLYMVQTENRCLLSLHLTLGKYWGITVLILMPFNRSLQLATTLSVDQFHAPATRHEHCSN
jgi:hypothetical protein